MRGSPTAATSISNSTRSSLGEKLEYFDPQSGERYIPHVIEPAAGADRATLAFLVDAYDEEVVQSASAEDGSAEGGKPPETRTVLRLHPRLAPVKVAVMPLVKKDGQPELAREIYEDLRARMQSEYDEGGSIGKRYRRQDEIGTPWGVTIDHQSIEDGTVTLRDRDSLDSGSHRDRGARRRARKAPGGALANTEVERIRREMDFDLTDEQELIRSTAREFTEKEIVEQAKQNARNHHFDLEIVKKIADQGYLGAIVPREYGGAGLDYISYGLVVEEIGRGCSSVRTVISVQTSLVCSAILKWGTEEQKQHYLPKLCSGEWLGCFGLTEPDTGSDAAKQRTRAKKTDKGWVINGAKMWISMGNYAKVALIFAQTDPELGHRGLACFMVDTDQPGYQASTIEHKMGLHASDTASIALEDVEVSDDQMLGEIGDGFKVAMSSLDSGRYSVAAGCVGICQGLRRGVGQIRQGARAVRQTDRELPARAGDDRRHGAEDRRLAHARVSRGLPQGQGPPEHAWRPRSPSCTPQRRRWSAQTRRSRCTAARATWTTTRSSATSATCASPLCTRAPRRSRS